MPDVIQVKNYSLSIKSSSGEKLILNDVTLDIEEGEILGMIGKSGSGKSLFGLSIADLLYLIETKISGEIFFDQNGTRRNILELSTKELQEYRRTFVSYIFQDPLTALNPSKTCGWQIDESIRFATPELAKRDRRELALKTIMQVELAEPERIYSSYPHELSGGQLQRIVIAMAIVSGASLIIADEPTSSLDNETENKILSLLSTLQSRLQFSLLFISHDIQLVKSFCDRIAIMDAGKIVEIGKTTDLYSNPQTDYLKELLATRESGEDEIKGEKDAVLQVNNLSHFYKQKKSLFAKTQKHHTLDSVSFKLYKSEILGLMGRSGSGKSTIAKLLIGIELPADGEILIDNLDLVDLWQQSPKTLHKRVQIIFQNPFSSLNPLQKVVTSISEVLMLHQDCDKRLAVTKTIKLLETVGLSAEYLERLPSQMSGGEQQRVSIARALAVNPEILVCDECVSALDRSTKYDLLDLLSRLRVTVGLTVLFISHDEEAITYLCDRIIYLRDGHLMSSASQADSRLEIL